MKRFITALIVIVFSNIIIAQQAQNTPTKRKLNIQFKEYDGLNGALLWGTIGVHTGIVAGGAIAAMEYDNTIDPLAQDAKNYRHSIYKNVLIGSSIVTGLSFVFAANDLVYYFHNRKNEKVTINLNVSPTSAGICMKF